MKIVVFLEPIEIKYAHYLKNLFPQHSFQLVSTKVELISVAAQHCKKFGTTKAIVSSQSLLNKLASFNDPNVDLKEVSTHKYRGSSFYAHDIHFLVLPTLKQLLYAPESPWLFKRWMQKLTNPNFPAFPAMDWKVLTQDNIVEFYEKVRDEAILVAVDIETRLQEVDPEKVKDNPEAYQGIWTWAKKKIKSGKVTIFYPVIPLITMVGYACLFKNSAGEYYSETGVLYIRDFQDLHWFRRFNETDAPKVMQNGGYDSSYFIRYQAPLKNYLFDTFIWMHSWLVELPRTLAFITSLFDRDYIYWKDEAEFRPAEYNAKDCHNTLWSMVYMLQGLQDYVYENYTENFRMQFPCITCGMEGWLVDEKEKARLKQEREKKIAEKLARLEFLLSAPGINPNSPVQMLKVLKGLGFGKAKDTNDKTLQEFIDAHPLWAVIGELIQDIREDRKAVSTYFDVTLFNSRLMYELNPAGTDSGRMASKASNFWCGTQIQNIPLYSKSMLVADEGYVLNSVDNKQSESRCTAYMSEDQNLIAAVESPLDFHKTNASGFFGVPYEGITKDIRNVGKKVNHGANYNMGPSVLAQTMGRKAVLTAQKLLRLPAGWSIYKVCEYLLACFDKTYPDIRGKFYDEVIREIQTTGRLVGPSGWTRICFGDPLANKPTLNSYVAHGPQSLSVKLINDGFFDLWLKLQIKESKVRFKAQVHDDLIWQCKPEDVQYTKTEVSTRLMKPITVRGRTLIIPNDPVTGGHTWKDLKDD